MVRTTACPGGKVLVALLAVAPLMAGKPMVLPPLSARGSRIHTLHEQALELMVPARPGPKDGHFRVNPEASLKSRGLAGAIFPVAAPAVVMVCTEDGHGTGTIIDPSGLVLTNHHVIEDAERDPATGALIATVYLGQLGEDGSMRLIEKGCQAIVLKASEQKDLALLRLQERPDGIGALPFLRLARSLPRPGMETVSIGHPAAALLWTSRSCEISGIGNWPEDHIDFTLQRLTATGPDRAKLEQEMRKLPRRRIVMTTCGINPGDSGGPLLNPDGELVAVTFATPAGPDRKVSYDKFALHVHLDEVKAFLAEVPTTPEVPEPQIWPDGDRGTFLDLDKDGTMDALRVTQGEDGPASLLIDARQRSAKNIKIKDLSSEEGRQKFKFDVAIHPGKNWRVLYDTDGDGILDLMLVEPEAADHPSLALRRAGAAWKAEPAAQYPKLLDPQWVAPEGRKRLTRIFRKLRSS